MDPGLRRDLIWRSQRETMNPISCEADCAIHREGTAMTEPTTEGPPASRRHAGEVDQGLGPAVQLDHLRACVVREAESWIGTPFHHAARVKGAGVDCLMLLAEIYEHAGIAPHIEPSFYVPDWHLHRDA